MSIPCHTLSNGYKMPSVGLGTYKVNYSLRYKYNCYFVKCSMFLLIGREPRKVKRRY